MSPMSNDECAQLDALARRLPSLFAEKYRPRRPRSSYPRARYFLPLYQLTGPVAPRHRTGGIARKPGGNRVRLYEQAPLVNVTISESYILSSGE
jgi:hypothetical protein